ncbi:hypothetical protein LDO32_03995 [Luteimonas sp. Y-2-2-4F]|nr:hypothetical protein [Luteimonas sp. Y-2-2-4F]MCD9030895.1 hypothetical protein [Luteimonas sp. Y-2-2-4F]
MARFKEYARSLWAPADPRVSEFVDNEAVDSAATNAGEKCWVFQRERA